MRIFAFCGSMLLLFASSASFSNPTEQVFQISTLTGEPIAPEPVSDAYMSAYQAHKTARAGTGAGVKPLEDFIASNPDVAAKAEAQFWLGMAYLDVGKSAFASKAFDESYKNDPKGRYAPLALFKLGSTLYGQDKPAEACAALDRLETTFTAPQYSNLRLAGNDRRIRIDCPVQTTTASLNDIEPSIPNQSASNSVDYVAQNTQVFDDYRYQVGPGRACIQYPTATVGRFSNTVIASKNQSDVYNKENAVNLGYRLIDQVRQESADRCKLGSTFYIINFKDQDKCPFFKENGYVNTECFYRNDIDYVVYALEHPKNYKSSNYFNYSLMLSRKTQALLDQRALEKSKERAVATEQAAAALQEAKTLRRNAFKQSAMKNVPKAYATIGKDMVSYFSDQCPPEKGWPPDASCRDFLFGQVEYLPIDRADSANGITNKVNVYGSMLYREKDSLPWKIRCNKFLYIQFRSGEWRRVTVYSLSRCG